MRFTLSSILSFLESLSDGVPGRDVLGDGSPLFPSSSSDDRMDTTSTITAKKKVIKTTE